MADAFHVEYSKNAVKAFSKMDNFNRRLILSWIGKNLEGCEDPRRHGKGLTGNHAGEWRYRIGDFRVIAEIQDSKLIILALAIGHRSDVFR